MLAPHGACCLQSRRRRRTRLVAASKRIHGTSFQDWKTQLVRYSPGTDIWSPIDVTEVAALFTNSSARWWLSGGCAVDHRLGRRTRDHGDIDVSVVRADWQALLGQLPGHLEPFAAMGGELLALSEKAADPALHNIWVRDQRSTRWVLQVNFEAGDDTAWRYRRDPRVTTDWDSAVSMVESVPTGTLATQLLWKSPRPRPKDDADLSVALPVLGLRERRWLAEAISLAHPNSPWSTGDRIPTR